MTAKTTNSSTHKRPGALKAHLAMAAFVVVAVTSLSLTSAGLYHAVAQTNASTAIVTQSGVAQLIGALR